MPVSVKAYGTVRVLYWDSCVGRRGRGEEEGRDKTKGTFGVSGTLEHPFVAIGFDHLACLVCLFSRGGAKRDGEEERVIIPPIKRK